MRLEDALRKTRLLRQVKPQNGSSEAEAESATQIIRTLMDRFAVKPEDVRPITDMPPFRMTWVYWDSFLAEYGLELRRFGKRGSVPISGDTQALIRLDTGLWRVQRGQNGSTQVVAEGKGVETFQVYLNKNAPRMYSQSNNRRSAFHPR
jgi:hypothetical protein